MLKSARLCRPRTRAPVLATRATFQRRLQTTQPTQQGGLTPEEVRVMELKASLEEAWSKPSNTDLRQVDRRVLEDITGVPAAHLGRTVHIEKTSKFAGQQGWGTARDWLLKFQVGEGWYNPLMGWTSTRDPLVNMCLSFPTEEAAVNFAKANGFEYTVDKTTHYLAQSTQTYASNFTYRPPRKSIDI